jgi:hypothetical protein
VALNTLLVLPRWRVILTQFFHLYAPILSETIENIVKTADYDSIKES